MILAIARCVLGGCVVIAACVLAGWFVDGWIGEPANTSHIVSVP